MGHLFERNGDIMRKLWVAIGLLACTALAGCNNNFAHKKVAAPQPLTTCNCSPPIRGSEAAPAAVPEHRAARRYVERRHAERRYAVRRAAPRHYARVRSTGGSRQYEWNTADAEASVDIYNYTSGSTSSQELSNDRDYGRSERTVRKTIYVRREGSSAYGYEGGTASAYAGGGTGYATGDGRQWTAPPDCGAPHAYGSRWTVPADCRAPAPNQVASTQHVWQDGFGRRHVFDDSAVAHYTDQNLASLSATAGRDAAWGGYHEWIDYNGDGYPDW